MSFHYNMWLVELQWSSYNGKDAGVYNDIISKALHS